MRRAALVFAVIGALSVAGCSAFDEPLFTEESISGSDEVATLAKSPVVRIDSLELGRLYRGYMLTATGVAPGVGYFAPELRIRYGGELGPDGFFEFDFVAASPADPNAGRDAPITARVLRGDFQLSPEMLRAARGVRVWSSRDSVEGRF
ncbi:MAG: hypothetical protein AAF401_08625 [Pseudomonadota bacterium]